MRSLLILLLLTLLTGATMFFYGKKYSNIEIEFQKLRPVKGRVNVYYNGFNIGYTKGIHPCALSKGVCVDVALKRKMMFLPENVEAKMKQKRIHERKYEDYIEIIYPKTPSYIEIKDNAIIKGELAAGFHNYLNEEVSYNEMEKIKTELLQTSENLQKATSILVDILYSLNNMAKSSEKDIQYATKNINSSMKNINSITNKIDKSLETETMKNIMQNIDNTSNNLNYSTNSLRNITYGVETSNVMTSFESITKNADEIVQGVNCNLRKNFGLLRILFGKTIK